MSVRLHAAQILAAVLKEEGSLATELPLHLEHIDESEHSLLRELCFGSFRFLPRLQLLAEQLLSKPLKRKDQDVQALILLGLYQLGHLRIPAHAAISETVKASQALKKPWAKGLINACLRNYQRQQQTLEQQLAEDPVYQSAHPAWLIGKLRKHWPEQYSQILSENNQQAPMTLRVNRRQQSRQQYAQQLDSAGIGYRLCPFSDDGLSLTQPVDVYQLPGFAEGAVSVQDEAAQLAGSLLDPQPGERLLDACAAPGGKTCHLLELQPELTDCLALDASELRLQRVRQNLDRLQLDCRLIAADASSSDWWDGQPFDRMLVDAPCSATGVIRRNPDIKHLRKPEEVATLAQLQLRILANLWPMLKPGGRLLYATCSLMPQENEKLIDAFCQQQADALEQPIDADWGQARPRGRQLFPQPGGHDGFYYAVLEKAQHQQAEPGSTVANNRDNS